jgi:dTDP-4-amino-4,6-dideoxygalactose transaminase
MIPITKTKLPDLSRYVKHLERAWKNGIVTNGGELVTELEEKLAQYLNVKHVSLVNNGTIGLMIALKALNLPKGNIITTPYTYVATTAAIRWAGYDIKFADIQFDDFNIDPDEIVKHIDENTVAIMPVHVYGVPCNIDAIQAIADKYRLKVVYDSSHCFGVGYEDSIKTFVDAGDYSVMSLHATKVLGTGEGGLIISKDEKAKKAAELVRSFGLQGDQVMHLDGLNGKLSELHAAFGLASLEILHHNIHKRRLIYRRYKSQLDPNKIMVYDLEARGLNTNYLYFPVMVYESSAKDLKDTLFAQGVMARRYFYPSLNDVYDKGSVYPVSQGVSERMLCLPIFPELPLESVDKICNIINNT